MEKLNLSLDIKTICITVQHFPNGITDAFQELQNFHPSICERAFYGLSFESKNGNIIYKAAVEEKYEGEAARYGCETFVIKKGEYLIETLTGFLDDLHIIPGTFTKLKASSQIDPHFPCVEWYKSDKELLCMVRIKPHKKIKQWLRASII